MQYGQHYYFETIYFRLNMFKSKQNVIFFIYPNQNFLEDNQIKFIEGKSRGELH